MAPERVNEYAAQAVSYIQAALGVEIDYTGDTLPVVDHYLRSVPGDRPAMVELVVATAGAYFGEVVRRTLGGQWIFDDDSPTTWRLVLPTGLSFVPAALVAGVWANVTAASAAIATTRESFFIRS